MTTENDAIAEMARARRVARATVAECLRRKEAAYDAGDYDEFDRCAAAYRDALNAEDQAARRLIAALANPTDADVKSLKDAADDLEARLEAEKNAAATIGDVAVGITILMHAILLFGLA